MPLITDHGMNPKSGEDMPRARSTSAGRRIVAIAREMVTEKAKKTIRDSAAINQLRGVLMLAYASTRLPSAIGAPIASMRALFDGIANDFSSGQFCDVRSVIL